MKKGWGRRRVKIGRNDLLLKMTNALFLFLVFYIAAPTLSIEHRKPPVNRLSSTLHPVNSTYPTISLATSIGSNAPCMSHPSSTNHDERITKGTRESDQLPWLLPPCLVTPKSFYPNMITLSTRLKSITTFLNKAWTPK